MISACVSSERMSISCKQWRKDKDKKESNYKAMSDGQAEGASIAVNWIAQYDEIVFGPASPFFVSRIECRSRAGPNSQSTAPRRRSYGSAQPEPFGHQRWRS